MARIVPVANGRTADDEAFRARIEDAGFSEDIANRMVADAIQSGARVDQSARMSPVPGALSIFGGLFLWLIGCGLRSPSVRGGMGVSLIGLAIDVAGLVLVVYGVFLTVRSRISRR
jgi:hypothetical protein